MIIRCGQMTQIFVAVIIINFQRARGDVLTKDQEINRDCGLMVQAMWGGRSPRPPEPENCVRRACYNFCMDCLPHHHTCDRPYHLAHRHFDDVIMICKLSAFPMHEIFTVTWIAGVAVNIIFLATQHANQTDFWQQFLDAQNLFFVSVFTVEMIIKLIAFGFKGYLLDSWNRFDALLVFASWASIIEDSLWFFRLFRALRYLLSMSYLALLIAIALLLPCCPLAAGDSDLP